MAIIENSESYLEMLPFLEQARFGAYLIFPFQFRQGEFHSKWADSTFLPRL